MNDLKRWFLHGLLVGWTVFSVAALEPTVFMPGAAAVWKDAEAVPRAGFTLKGVGTSMDGGYIMWTAFDLRVFQDVQDGTSQIDLSWPGFFGMVYPGVSLELENGELIPWVYGEVDLFYFPFLFATLIVVEKPWFIPSVYMGPRFGPAGTGWNAGIRLSVPLPPGGLFRE